MNEDNEITVLIIEDDKMFRDLAFQVFEGCNRITANDAEEGFKKFKKHCPDITLLDIGLPGQSGLELLPDLIGYDPEAFVVMLTASHMAKDVEYAKAHGATGYITKPFTYKKVEECIAKYHEYQKKLQELTPEERALNIAKELKIEAINEDLRKQQEKQRRIEEKKKHDALIEKELKNWNLLFVDDHPSNRVIAGKRIAKIGYNVDLADSGENAIKMATKTNYDIILMDSVMPGTDGYQAADSIRYHEKEENKPRAIIICMLEHTYEIEEKFWQKADMDTYITKPAKISEVNELIKGYIDKRLTGEKSAR